MQLLVSLSQLLIQKACANNPQLTVNIGPNADFYQFAGRMTGALATAMGSVVISLFLIGAFMYVLSGVKEDMRERGKTVMIGSLIGLVVVLGAFVILRITFGLFIP